MSCLNRSPQISVCHSRRVSLHRAMLGRGGVGTRCNVSPSGGTTGGRERERDRERERERERERGIMRLPDDGWMERCVALVEECVALWKP